MTKTISLSTTISACALLVVASCTQPQVGYITPEPEFNKYGEAVCDDGTGRYPTTSRAGTPLPPCEPPVEECPDPVAGSNLPECDPEDDGGRTPMTPRTPATTGTPTRLP